MSDFIRGQRIVVNTGPDQWTPATFLARAVHSNRLIYEAEDGVIKTTITESDLRAAPMLDEDIIEWLILNLVAGEHEGWLKTYNESHRMPPGMRDRVAELLLTDEVRSADECIDQRDAASQGDS